MSRRWITTGGAKQRGVSLIELMVGVAIGMVGLLVIYQTLSVWDARTRVAAAGSDAQMAGSIGLYNLERDIRLAGMGFAKATVAEMGCQVVGFDNTASAPVSFPLAPVVIVDHDVDHAPDELAVLYGNSTFMVVDVAYTNATAFDMRTPNRTGLHAGDLAVVTDRACTQRLVQVTDEATAVNEKTLTHAFGMYADFYSAGASKPARYNPAAGTGTTFTQGNVYNLGPTPRRNNWRVVGDTLGFSDDIGVTPFFGVAEGIADMKLQYGVDTNGDGRIGDDEWTKGPIGDWTRVRAVRVALLVRSRNFEKTAASNVDVTWISPNPQWSGGPNSTPIDFVMRNVDGTWPDNAPLGDPNNWRHYRYRVYERVIPLRNVIWNH